MTNRSVPSALLLMTGVLALGFGCRVQITDGYVFDYSGETSEKTESGTIDARVKTIEIKNKFGDVDVASSTDDSNWTWDGKCWATNRSDAEELVSQLEMDVAQDGDRQTWTIVLPERSRKLRGVRSKLAIRVPSEVSVVIANEHGTLNNEVFQSIIAETEHSDVEVLLPPSAKPQLDLTVDHGEVKSDFQSSEVKDSPRIRIKTEHGDIAIREK